MMKTIANEPISPCLLQRVAEGEDGLRANKPSDPKEWNYPVAGLTKREYFAGLALQGLVSRQAPGSIEVYTAHAVVCADALIEALNRE